MNVYTLKVIDIFQTRLLSLLLVFAPKPYLTQYNFIQNAKYGVPVEKRQYNWMQVPPPPEESGGHITTPKERLEKHIVSQC